MRLLRSHFNRLFSFSIFTYIFLFTIIRLPKFRYILLAKNILYWCINSSKLICVRIDNFLRFATYHRYYRNLKRWGWEIIINYSFHIRLWLINLLLLTSDLWLMAYCRKPLTDQRHMFVAIQVTTNIDSFRTVYSIWFVF